MMHFVLKSRSRIGHLLELSESDVSGKKQYGELQPLYKIRLEVIIMNWKLNKVGNIDCTMDNSGVYTIINRVMETEYGKGAGVLLKGIRVDIMSTDGDEPLQSFIGKGNDVRKAVISWLNGKFSQAENCFTNISSEHTSYIGYEISRAEADTDYVQN